MFKRIKCTTVFHLISVINLKYNNSKIMLKNQSIILQINNQNNSKNYRIHNLILKVNIVNKHVLQKYHKFQLLHMLLNNWELQIKQNLYYLI